MGETSEADEKSRLSVLMCRWRVRGAEEVVEVRRRMECRRMTPAKLFQME